MIMAASGLLSKNPRPSREDIVSSMNRNLCRCGVYQRIVEAIQTAASNSDGRKGVAT
jgi:aerobic-type carbon monoxide dehydrogenase small subunit (CoxS/CutS family)